MNIRYAVVLALLPLCSCIIAPDAKPSVDLGVEAATQYNHRGMVMNDNGVLQPSASIFLPAKAEGEIEITSWGNLDLTSDPGNAWFPDGNGGRFSEIDFIGSYARRCGDYDIKLGVHNYNLPKGDQFPFGERGATVEIFGSISREIAKFRPFIELRRDVDESDGFYAQGGCERVFKLDDHWSARLEGYIAYNDAKAAEWAYGLSQSGLADARITGQMLYAFQGGPTVDFTVAGSTMLDQDERDWFDSLNIDSNNVWAAVGATWSY